MSRCRRFRIDNSLPLGTACQGGRKPREASHSIYSYVRGVSVGCGVWSVVCEVWSLVCGV